MATFLTHYSQSIERLQQVAEERLPLDSSTRPPERLISAIWFDQRLDHDNLRTTEGARVSIVSPGRWNAGPGPDFLDAGLRFSGAAEQRGDIEVEVFASDWDAHGHAENERFNNVILKVCLWDDSKRKSSDGIPVLPLFDYIIDPALLKNNPGIASYPFVSPSMRGRCTSLIEKQQREKALAFIESAGDSRIDAKARRLARLARTFGYDQTLYIGLMEAMGFSQNKGPMNAIAHNLTLARLHEIREAIPLQEHQEAILAAFYGSAGLFQNGASEEADYLKRLEEKWLAFAESVPWLQELSFVRTRPANNPYRRLAAISHLLATISSVKLFDYFIALLGKVENPSRESATKAVKRIKEFFDSLEDPFWNTRFAFSSKSGSRQYALIGENLAVLIIANVLVPLMLAWARTRQQWGLEAFLHVIMSTLGGLPHNHKTKFACARLFGPEMTTPGFARNARIHHGLLQVYEDFCKHLRRDCPDCGLMTFFED